MAAGVPDSDSALTSLHASFMWTIYNPETNLWQTQESRTLHAQELFSMQDAAEQELPTRRAELEQSLKDIQERLNALKSLQPKAAR